MSFDLESCEASESSGCSIDDKLPSKNCLIRGKEGVYAVGRKISQGRYGAVYEVLRRSDGKPFACKLEICEAYSHGLDQDYSVMNKVAKKDARNLVRMIDRGKIEDHFKFIIMPLLGENLMNLSNYIVLDMCTEILRGTNRYASLAAHYGEEQSPKDDLESWFYMMIELISGHLPWTYLHRDQTKETAAMKEHCKNGEGFHAMMKYCPKVEFRRIQTYLNGLTYQSSVDYTFITEMVQLAMRNNAVKMNEKFDWQE
ncbi:unnamed protein product [Caenorhabditis bovis]|uniref:Protein kinase domain-containing protein n=1 Tax=Caenorhabditis bovis TaxID=2654633 RepID=A0A8S1E755_9PELO|nr:unnamed protein product [Caenorhabditis bovis]